MYVTIPKDREDLFFKMKVKYFVIFHKKIHEECYSELSDEELKKFCFVAVNPKIQKEYPTDPKYSILKEWELPIYYPTLQELNFRENSFLVHCFVNKLYEEFDFVGFFQYDMYFKKDSLNFDFSKVNCLSCHYITTYINNPTIPMGSIQRCIDIIWVNNPGLKSKFSHLSKFPLENTYVLPKNLFMKTTKYLLHFINHKIGWPLDVVYVLDDANYHNAVYLEYLMGFLVYIFAETECVEMKGITHVPEMKIG
jgi:hypothetical protein